MHDITFDMAHDRNYNFWKELNILNISRLSVFVKQCAPIAKKIQKLFFKIMGAYLFTIWTDIRCSKYKQTIIHVYVKIIVILHALFLNVRHTQLLKNVLNVQRGNIVVFTENLHSYLHPKIMLPAHDMYYRYDLSKLSNSELDIAAFWFQIEIHVLANLAK